MAEDRALIVAGINTTSISQVARGERKKAGGYKWIYKNENFK